MASHFHDRLKAAIARAGAPICVGLDPDPKRIPPHLGAGVASAGVFLQSIINSTQDLAAAFKPNTAFFECYGADGWSLLEELREWIGPDTLLIADAKRGDVLHTNEAYATALFGRIRADAVTVQPYLGGEPLEPFCRRPEKGMFVLCATSNPGGGDIQNLETGHGPLFLEVAWQAKKWSAHRNVGLVVGTTKPEALQQVLSVAPDLPLLLPGGGAQGGDAANVNTLLKNSGTPGLFNFSRSVLYASPGNDFADAARAEVMRMRKMLGTGR